MDIATLIEIVEEAGASLSRSVLRYWPVNGRNEVGERNQTLHLAGAFLRREWNCWAEAHSDRLTDRRHDLVAWHEPTRTLCIIEAKRLYSPAGVAAIGADGQRLAAFCPIVHDGPGALAPERCFGLMTATTWTRTITEWWQSEAEIDPWPAGTAAWPDARDRAIKAANRGLWRAISLHTESDRGESDRHQLLYALWAIT